MENEKDIYRKLQEHLDKLPVGFPPTATGVEIRILKRFFAPIEAEIAIRLSLLPEPLKSILLRLEDLDINIDEAEDILDRMLNKGLINGGKNPKNGEKYFSNAMFVVGIFEYQVGRLTKDFMEDFEQYIDEAFKDELVKARFPQFRTVPVEKSIKAENFVATYDDIKKVIESSSTISVSNCICREGKKVLGKGCSHTMETCFQLGSAAHHYIALGMGRKVSSGEALEIIRKSQAEGLVIQPGNSQKPFAICCCCSCCCEVLNTAKKYPNPSEYFSTNHISNVDPELCTGCETCIEICPMDAIKLENETAGTDPGRCIGCGICVPSCPSDAIGLQKKEVETIPPGSNAEMYMKIMQKKADSAH